MRRGCRMSTWTPHRPTAVASRAPFITGKSNRSAAETAEFFHFPRKRGDTARRAYLDGAEGGGVGGDGKGGHDYVRVRLVRDV